MSTEFSEGAPKRTEAVSTQFSEGAPERSDPPPVRVEEDQEREPEIAYVGSTSNDKIIAVMAHGAGFLTWILAPLILYFTQPDRRSFAAWHCREAFNFQASLTIYYCLPLPILLLGFIDLSLLPVSALLLAALTLLLVLLETIIVIWASIAAAYGKRFRILVNIPFIPRPKEFSNPDAYVDRE